MVLDNDNNRHSTELIMNPRNLMDFFSNDWGLDLGYGLTVIYLKEIQMMIIISSSNTPIIALKVKRISLKRLLVHFAEYLRRS